MISRNFSSLHWLNLDFLYAVSVQWGVLANQTNSPPPIPILHIISAQTILLMLKHNFDLERT